MKESEKIKHEINILDMNNEDDEKDDDENDEEEVDDIEGNEEILSLCEENGKKRMDCLLRRRRAPLVCEQPEVRFSMGP